MAIAPKAVAKVQKRNPHVRLISVCDCEGDCYELIETALRDPEDPELLVRAKNDCQLQEQQGWLVEAVMVQLVAGYLGCN